MDPDRLAHYRIIERLGAGGMGEVLLAEDLRLGRKVALKVLPASIAADPAASVRLFREARAAAMLDHPNVATIYEAGEDDGRAYIAMQYVAGETLASRIARRSLSPQEILTICVDVAAALAAAHAAGVVHRDIKPQNIMITADTVKVLDFGLARIGRMGMDETDMETLTKAGLVAGTVPYMSPEQLRGEHVDGRSDIFSFGVVAYEMLSGRRPFNGNSTAEMITAVLFSQPPQLRLPVGPLQRLAGVVNRALAKEAAQRFDDTGALLNELKAILHDFDRVSDEVTVAGVAGANAAVVRTANARPVRSSGRPRVNRRAMELYTKGRLQWDKRTPESFKAAIALFQEAIERAPTFARAYAGLADCYSYLGFMEIVSPPDVMPAAKTAAKTAIDLDPTLGEPHTSLAYAMMLFDWTWDEVEDEFRKALRLDPEYPMTPHWYCIHLLRLGRFEEALQQAEAARKLNSLAPMIHDTFGLVAQLAGRHEEAIRVHHNVLEIYPNFVPAYYYLGLAYEQLGRIDEAIRAFEHACAISPLGMMWLSALGHTYGVAGRRDEARKILKDFQARSEEQYLAPFSFGLVHLGLGAIDESLAYFERAFAERSPHMPGIFTDGRFRALRRDHRFSALQSKYGLRLPEPQPA